MVRQKKQDKQAIIVVIKQDKDKSIVKILKKKKKKRSIWIFNGHIIYWVVLLWGTDYYCFCYHYFECFVNCSDFIVDWLEIQKNMANFLKCRVKCRSQNFLIIIHLNQIYLRWKHYFKWIWKLILNMINLIKHNFMGLFL